MVLIDGGNMHNFINQSVVAKLGLPIVRDKPLQVMVANCNKIECIGKCLSLTLQIQGCPIQTDFYILPMAACEAVLGV